MENGQPTPEGARTDKLSVEKMLAEYERAQDVGHHTDTVIHEITAIVWGANTLLLGFILEVDCRSDNQKLVLVAAVLGFLMSAYVPLVMHWTKKGQQVAYKICRDIEDELPLAHRLNNRIRDAYPKWKPGQKAVWVLTIFFLVAWFYVAVHAWSCLHVCRA
jgi:hypothetical protein